MANVPDWFLQAVSFGNVNGSSIPKWFAPEEPPEPEVDTRIKVSGDWPKLSVGAGYRRDQVKPYSHYYDPIQDRQWKGRSRKWGDVDPDVADYARTLLMEEAKTRGLDLDDTAMVLAIAHHESGFNPDAASNESASGLGQFIDATGAHYGLKATNRWDIKEQARALVEHYLDNKKLAEEKGYEGLEYTYAFHHDGPSLAYGGLGIAKKHVMPKYSKYKEILQSGNSSIE